MKKLILRAFLLILLPTLSLLSQITQQTEITEGKEFWFGLPHCKMLQPEAIRGEFPVAVWISSKVKTQATISASETGTNIQVNVEPNKITQVPLPDNLMNRESEVAKNFGIHVQSKDPISVAVYLSYRWSGEAYRVIPVEWLGKRYFSANLYQDETDEMKPGQILIVATQNGTVVKYKPTFNTYKVKMGAMGSVTLDKGQTFLIEGLPTKGLSQDWSTDLSGTMIDANKPVGVISGHTKGAFPRYYIGQRSGWMEPYANFSRNMLCDMLWPVELWGQEYVSAPLKYLDRPRGKTVVQDDAGDLIRFVAGFDNTELYQMRQDGSSLMKIGKTLKRGEWYNITNQEVSAYYWSSKPVLAVQYGKTWWLDNGMMGPITKKDPDQPQNPYRNGQGMMIVLAPISHWCGYATFRSPEAMDNFIYITFREKDRNKFKFDGTLITSKWGSSIQPINGTEYAYITEVIAAGDHWIEGIDSAKFAGYAYGNWDREKDGFAYGYPIGVNFTIPCEDSLYIIDNQLCGDVNGKGFSVPDTAECSGIFTVDFKYDSTASYNYDFILDPKFTSGDKTASYNLKVQDITKPARGVVTVITRSGKALTKTYEYFPETITATPTFIDFGQLKVGQKVCKNFTIENTGVVPVTIKKLWLKNNTSDYTITTTDFPVTLQPGEKKVVEVCATASVLSPLPVKDSVMADLSCYSRSIVGLMFTTGDPVVYIYDQTWGQVPVGNEVPKTVNIVNKSNTRVELYSVDWQDHTHFTKVEGLPTPDNQGGNFTAPFVLEANETKNFTVYYKPNQFGVPDSTTAFFTGNTDKEKLYSAWSGIGTQPGPEITRHDWGILRVIDQWAGVQNYPAKIQITNLVGDADVAVTSVTIEDDPDGVFSLEQADVPKILKTQSTVDIRVYFAPKAEKYYESKVVLDCQWNNETITKFNYLTGTGKQPHFLVQGHDYGPAIPVGNSIDDFGAVVHVTNKFPMELTVFSLDITGPDKSAFTIDPAFLADNSKWGKVSIGGKVDVPIKFTALHPGIHNATLVAGCDAPDTSTGALIGRGFTKGLYTSDYNHGTLFVTQNNTGRVYLTNTGSDPVNITRDINVSMTNVIGEPAFTIIGWSTALTKLVNPAAPFVLGSNDTLFVDVKFNPMTDKNIVKDDPNETRSYQAKIDYITDGGTGVSNVYGKGTIMRTVARIPSGVYVAKPGTTMEIAVKLERYSGESKPLNQANINDITTEITYKSNGMNHNQDVYPTTADMADKTPFGCKDIIKNGTATANWTCIKADTVNGATTLQVHQTGSSPLALTAPSVDLFRVKMNTFLSDLSVIPLFINLRVNGDANGYTVVDNYPGDVRIQPVCVDTLRLIQLTGQQFSLSAPQPNPVANSASIDYSVGFPVNTTIILYNNSGEKVATLVDGYLKSGQYRINIDVNRLGLPSGVYHYKMESGPYNETKALVITK